ncbi:protein DETOXIFICATION 44, chloroplastic-like isoform X2 [Trifolium pratense]|uniref:protein DETOXIFICATION 44, chloroplastic-like isoform X2 n=1 Tax=Trifolium pratense TaxID=57577 RepID=UPI001E697EE8|nr:protein DETOXIFICATION 44, chloroplastic-like isoform X2 [Trifolium pratense]
MASSSSSTCFLCSNRNSIPYFKFSTTLKSPTTLTTNPPPPHFFPRLRLHRVSPNNKNPTTTTDDDDDDDDDDDSLDTTSPLKSPSPFPHFRNDWFKFDELGMEMLSIALPAAVALAADPIASLIDTAFVGHIGAVELAAVGVSASVFNLVSKVFNVPLLNITTSFVAEEQALIGKEEDSGRTEENGKFQRKKLLSSVSTSLALAAALGIAETVALSLGSGTLMTIMGIAADSPIRGPAEHFLTLRAFGALPIVIALAAQGTFRGFKDTKTPLYAVGAGNFLNVILDPILIFLCGLGISGAAIATVISEFLIAFILLWNLSGKVLLIPFDFDGTKFFSYLKSGGLLIARTLAVFITMTLTTSLAANQGPIPMAGHQICMQVWLSISLLTDALALAGQALLASSYSLGNYEQARLIIYRVIQIGLGAGISLSMILFVGFGPFSTLFSTDSEVLDVARSGILFVAGSQPVNALAFVIDGIYYGVSDFEYAAYSMVVVGLISSIFMLVATPVVGLPGVWTGLFLFMMLRVLAGVWRLSSKSGPWDMVWYKDGAED